MTPMRGMAVDKPVFYDTDCLECFLFVDAGHILEKLFSNIIIPEQVYNELMDVNTPSVVKTNYNKLKRGFVEINHIEFASQEYVTYKSIEKGFWSKTGKVCGSGESAAMALAHLNNGIVASNNLSDVDEYIESLNFALITSSMILSIAFEKDIIGEDDANDLWKKILKKGIELPRANFSKYYNELYQKDYKRFLK